MKPVLIVGGGNMGGAFARRFQEALRPVVVVEHNAARADALRALDIAVYTDIAEAPETDTLILAIKPQQFAEVAATLAPHIQPDTLVISLMAGVALARLHALSPRAVRVMPNLPALVGESMSVACAPEADEATRAQVTELLELAGRAAWVETEEQLHLVTAISGSGPGYVFAFMEALEQAAIAGGLDAATARTLVAQTFRGAALLADESPESFTRLREQVTSPGGTTQAALEVFAKQGLKDAVQAAVHAAAARSKELA